MILPRLTHGLLTFVLPLSGMDPSDIDNTKTAGINPIVLESVQVLGRQVARNSATHRDLGFTGRLGKHWYAVWADTLWCDHGVTDAEQDTPGFHGMVRSSISLMTDDPLSVIDLHLNNDDPVPHPLSFFPHNPDWNETGSTAFGGASICEIDEEKELGAIYYLVVSGRTFMFSGFLAHTLTQNAFEPDMVGAGVGKVQVIYGVPTVTERMGERGYWWDANLFPHYGDKICYRDERSDYIYIWGGPPNRINGWLQGSYMFLARVKATDAFDLPKYEYFWGRQQGWKSEPLTVFSTETAAMWGTGQGQITWNDYYQCYILVHLGIGQSHALGPLCLIRFLFSDAL